MAPLASNNTPRLYIDYTAGGQRHTMEVRGDTSSTAADAISAYAALVPKMTPLMYNTDSVIGARWSDVGSNLSFPLVVTSAAGANVTTLDADLKPNFVSFTGRSNDGRRVRVTFFTPVLNLKDTGYRIATPTGDVAALYTVLKGATVDARTISGNTPIWNSYANYGANAYYQRKFRRT